MAQKPTLPQGTRDFSPIVVLRRKFILSVIERVFKKYGFMPLETPAIEQLSTLTGKYGDEGDQLLFKILNSGDYLKKLIEYQEKALGHEEIDATYLPSFDGKLSSLDFKKTTPWLAEKGLRYDLTVPFARYVVMNRNDISFPFKRYQMQPVWRADKPQKGRYREFWQCDADIIGSNGMLNEAELVKIYDEVFEALGIPVNIKVNNRKLLSALATLMEVDDLFYAIPNAIDKLDKIGLDKVLLELANAGLNPNQLTILSQFLSLGESMDNFEQVFQLLGHLEEGKKGCEELNQLFDFLKILEIKNTLSLDLTLARGLTYYTGAIIEVQAKTAELKSSIGGGGRYDNLTGIFGMPDISGVGISFGLDRIYDVMEELNLFPENLKQKETKVLFCYFDEKTQAHALKLCQQIRNQGKSAEIFPDVTKKIGKQLDYANKLKIDFACIVGSEEMENLQYGFRNLISGEQQQLSIEQIIEIL